MGFRCPWVAWCKRQKMGRRVSWQLGKMDCQKHILKVTGQGLSLAITLQTVLIFQYIMNTTNYFMAQLRNRWIDPYCKIFNRYTYFRTQRKEEWWKRYPRKLRSCRAFRERARFSSAARLERNILKSIKWWRRPWIKILGVKGGHTSDEGDSISELYTILCSSDPEDPVWKWPTGLVPFCHWGCAIYSCFDATKEGYPVIWFDTNMRKIGEPMEQQFI